MTTLPPRQEWAPPQWRDCAVAAGQTKRESWSRSPCESGAGNESRTRDLNLGKVALYQLSYSRRGRELYHRTHEARRRRPVAMTQCAHRTATVSTTVAIASA